MVQRSASVLWQQLRQSAALPGVWLELTQSYLHHDLPWQAAYAARQAVRVDAELLPSLQALSLDDWQNPGGGDALLGRPVLPEAQALAEHFAAFVQQEPGDWLTWLYLARLYDLLGQREAAQHALQQSQAHEFIPGEALHWLGVWRLNAGDAQGAVAAFYGLLDIRPMRFGSMMYLGDALVRIGNLPAAEKAFARAAQSPSPDFLMSLASRLYAHNYWQEAIAVMRRALELRPDSVPNLLALAKIQSEVYELAGCRESLARVLKLEPDNREAALLQAGLMGRMGDAKQHLALLQTEYENGGDPLSRLASSIAMTSLYHDELSAMEVAELHRKLCAPIAAEFTPKVDFANEWTTQRRLRIGYVTGDLHRQHPVNIFMQPILQRHDHRRFEICIYHTGAMFDDYTRTAQSHADHWLEAAKLDDAALHQQIVNDRIDILVDLAGHTSSHRLGVFALRSAPVQVTFLGYPHSTGLSTIDWLLGDAVVSPLEQAGLFSEHIAQLPIPVFCWSPTEHYPLPTPRPSDVPVVFASFNNAMKLSPRTVGLWAKVLQAVPDSRLLLKAPSLRDAAVRERFARLFVEQGISPERLEFRGPTGLADMMQEYGAVDIALDPVPYNGGTTTQQALWMGVPVVALEGDNFVGRMGASFLRSLGHPEWVAQNESQYVAIAAKLADQVDAIRGGRAALREQMQQSPLCDIDRYVREMEALYLRMWETRAVGMQNRTTGTSLPPVHHLPAQAITSNMTS